MDPFLRASPLAHRVDRFGAAASALCALHCALLPLVLAFLPALGLGFLADHRLERGFVVFASLLALASLLTGYRRHQRFRAFALLVPGIALLIAGVTLEQLGSLAHALLVASGGGLVALAHFVNLRLTHGHGSGATCVHGRCAVGAGS